MALFSRALRLLWDPADFAAGAPASSMALTGPVRDADNNMMVPTDTKASSLSLLPKGAYGPNAVFFSPDGGKTFFDISGDGTALAFISYWYCAIRWRAQKIAEAPLMVVEEDQNDGTEEWLPDHELVPILDMPSPDYDMGELLERTSMYLDNTGAALWVMDQDSAGRTIRITPFKKTEFQVKGDSTRLYATFEVQTATGLETFDAEQVCYFRDTMDGWGNDGRSRLDAALSWLRLGERAVQTVRDLLSNSVWPSGIVVADKDWNPDPDTLEAYKQKLQEYSKQGNKGQIFVALGGGTFESLQANIKDLVPEDILNRVESVVSAVTGVPAIVLQFQVGMENSPWSQMAQARKMAYDDTIIPTWARIERVLTRQMLRPIDEDPTHFVKFDSSTISSLQEDQLTSVQIATMMGRAASLNERRKRMGLEPVNDPKADEIPELTQPSMAELLAGTGGGGKPNGKDPSEDAPPEEDPTAKAQRWWALARKLAAPALQDTFREESVVALDVAAAIQLQHDADAIATIVHTTLLEEQKAATLSTKSRGKEVVMQAVTGYLKGTGAQGWAKATGPLIQKAAERSTAVVAASINLSFTVLHPEIVKFSKRTTGAMITDISETTRSLVSDIIQGGIEEGASTATIAKTIREAAGFSRTRSMLIARTETTKSFNGAPQESIASLSASTGRRFTKTWSGALDDRERDEHLAMEGETVGVDEAFSNGLMYPSEPNCRCILLFSEVED